MARYLPIFASVVLFGCSSIPYGEFDGRAESVDAHDVVVAFEDGVLVFDTETKPITVGANALQKLEPGHHVLAVRVAAKASSSGDDEALHELVLDVAPCTKYRFVGKAVEGRWVVVAAGAAPIAECRARSE